MDAFNDSEGQQQLQALIQHVFQPCQLGEAAGKRLDPLAQARGTATPVEFMRFLQSPVLREATEKYLHEIGALWLSSRNPPDAVPETREIPVPTSQAPASLQASDPELPAVLLPTPAAVLSVVSPVASPVAPPAAPPLASPVAVAAGPLSAPPPMPPLRPGLRPGQIPLAGMPLGKPAPPRIQFHLPNARVGQPYAARLEGQDSAGNPVSIRDARLPAALGLSFDAASGEMRGIPVVDGDYKVALRWSGDGVAEYAGECLLFVNPDPRSLWKQLEPPADDSYFKPHTDVALIAGPGFRIAAASRRGRSHEHVGSFRDDDFFIWNQDSGWSVLIVADGAGSAKNSRWGSKLAVAAAGEHIAAQLSGAFGVDMTQALAGWSTDRVAASQTMHAPFYRLFQEASKLAVQAIEQEADKQGTAAKDYATTLLAAAVRRDGDDTFLATFWMGDGAIAAYGPQGKLRLMGKPDSGEFAGQTRFLDRAALTDPEFGKRLVLGCYSGLNAVLLMTDGISDPRFETDNGLADVAKWDALWDEVSPLLAAPEPQKALLDWLQFFTPGHHDDRTIAVLW